MGLPNPEWRSNDTLPAGKGATAQEFVATVGDYRLEIKVAPCGEGDLKINALEICRVDKGKNRREAFGQLAKMAEQYLMEQMRKVAAPEAAWSALLTCK
jgi:enoyl-[acyl-carrier protein] reductase I